MPDKIRQDSSQKRNYTRRSGNSSNTADSSSNSSGGGKKDYSSMKFLAIMFLVVVVACLVFAVIWQNKEKIVNYDSDTVLETVTITFPEGLTVMQYGELLEENNVCSASDFYAAMRETDFTEDYSFLPSNDILQSREYPLEGYLYPDTYSFYVNESPNSVIIRFLNNFGSYVADELVEYANSNGEGFTNLEMSFDNAIIMASIVERESADDDQRPTIAACFYNRIENPSESGTGGKLQSDTTKFYPYVMSTVPDGFVSEYNTYNFVGLPKGPICNPSISSIKAAVYPDEDCDDYFFYTDVNGNHYYASTYAEHLENIQYCKENGLAE